LGRMRGLLGGLLLGRRRGEKTGQAGAGFVTPTVELVRMNAVFSQRAG